MSGDGDRDEPLPSSISDDPAVERKRAAMIHRLSLLHQSRATAKTDPNSNSSESTKIFLSKFSHSKSNIESTLTHLQQSNSVTDPKSELEKVSVSISELEKLVAENSYFLPSFEVRNCLKTVSDLRQSLDLVTAKLVPKKKFSFRSKAVAKAVLEPETTHIVDSNEIERNSEGGKLNSRFKVRDSQGFRGKDGEILVKEFKGEDVGEFVISDLSKCEVRLKGCLGALFVNRLRDCKVYVGPVLGSILIEDVEGCTFVLASHQIRIHHAKESDFYLRCRSRPIIEDSGGVKFAPYCLCYDGVEEDLKEANLDEETGNWANVDDFQWLRAIQSPNWSVLPENERTGLVKF